MIIARLLIAFSGGTWLERLTMLRGAVDLWIASDPISPADELVVLGEKTEARPFAVADAVKSRLICLTI